MTQYGFLIDNRKCIGCHACSVACKAENDVPLGVNRTWVKYVEKGTFPNTRRFFQVTRCNHCANPPCVHICPVTAMFQRPDGIVEFDPSLCIGCKACMQACPYDAIYMDPESHTAAKCHFCAHRTDVGLEPACVIVCPTHAIIAGDIEDPSSEISRLIGNEQVRVRKPDQNTLPKLFYINAEEANIVPGAANQAGGQIWSQEPSNAGQDGNGHHDWRGPIQISEDNAATAMIRSAARPREVYNAPHRVPWHWQVPAYLVTKAIGAGTFIVAAVGVALGVFPTTQPFTTIPALVSVLFMAVTTVLLVWDLDRPERFWMILVRPQWRSWLTRGSFILVGFSGLSALFFVAHLFDFAYLVSWLNWPAVALGVLSAIYTGFLFAQAEGRDMWQSSLLPWHMLIQALMSGAAGLLMLSPVLLPSHDVVKTLVWTFGFSLLVNLMITLGEMFAVPHASMVAATAAYMIRRGRYKFHYWGSLIVGLLVPLALVVLASTSPELLAFAGFLSVVGLFSYEWAYVMAPQQVPNS